MVACEKCNLPVFYGFVGYAGPMCQCRWDTPNETGGRDYISNQIQALLNIKIAERDGTIHALRHELAERDKLLEQREATILEQQALIDDIIKIAEKAKDTPNVHAWEIGLGNVTALASVTSQLALEAALKAERIKTLEDAADIAKSIHAGWVTADVSDELRRMAKELKEQ